MQVWLLVLKHKEYDDCKLYQEVYEFNDDHMVDSDQIFQEVKVKSKKVKTKVPRKKRKAPPQDSDGKFWGFKARSELDRLLCQSALMSDDSWASITTLITYLTALLRWINIKEPLATI